MGGRRTLSIIILLLIGTVSIAQEGNKTDLEFVNSQLEAGELKKALRTVEQHLKDDIENDFLLSKQAEIYHEMHRYEEARDVIKSILRRSPECSPALLLAAIQDGEQKNFEKALEHIDAAFENVSDAQFETRLFALKGNYLMKIGEMEAAEECLKVACSAEAPGLNTMCDLAQVLSNNMKHDEAIVVLESTIDRHGIQLRPLVLAGTIENKRERYDEAINYYDLALTLDGESPTVLAALAESYMYLDDFPTAEQKLRQALESEVESAYAQKVNGDFLMKSGDKQGACGAYNQAVAYGYAEDYGQVEILFLLTESCSLD